MLQIKQGRHKTEYSGGGENMRIYQKGIKIKLDHKIKKRVLLLLPIIFDTTKAKETPKHIIDHSIG